MTDFEPRFSADVYEAYIARAHADRAKFIASMLARVPGLVRKLFHRTPAPKVGSTNAMATACGARA